jgi:lycopene cyclase CruP
MFQRSLSARSGTIPERDFVNRLLRTNFGVMNDLGGSVLRPFLQDVVQLSGLIKTLLGATARDPHFIPQILRHVGAAAIVEWSGHVAMMALYTALHHALGCHILTATEDRAAGTSTGQWGPGDGNWGIAGRISKAWSECLPPRDRFMWRRLAESWMYGAGLDYEL